MTLSLPVAISLYRSAPNAFEASAKARASTTLGGSATRVVSGIAVCVTVGSEVGLPEGGAVMHAASDSVDRRANDRDRERMAYTSASGLGGRTSPLSAAEQPRVPSDGCRPKKF